jgi:hypothetical protein
MLTAWDTSGDASEFAAALTRWVRSGQRSRVARAGRRQVLAFFASSPDALRAGLEGLG